MTEQLTEQLTELFRKARKDLTVFRHYIQLHDAEPSERLPATAFHKQWSDELLFGLQSIAVEAFRESGKSSIIRAFLLYVLTFPNKNLCYIAVMRGNKTAASKIIKEVSAEYQRNIFTHGAIKTILEDSAEAFCVETYKGVVVRLEAYGKGSAIRGASYGNRRPDVVVLDDIQDKEDMRSPTIPDTDWDWFLSDIKFLGRNTRFFMIGNNLGDKCIIERLLGTADENNVGLFGFTCYRVPAMIEEQATWSDRFTAEFLLAEKAEMQQQGKLDIWLMERMCLAISEESRIFRASDFQYYSWQMKADILPKCKLYLLSDLASSTKSSSDYRVLMLIGVDEDSFWYIIECRYGRWQATEYLDEMFDMVQTYKLPKVYPEDGQILQTLDSIIRAKQEAEQVYFVIDPIKHKGRSKQARIELLQPRFRAHKILFEEKAAYLGELENELLSFTVTGTKALHDDLADILAYGEDICRPPLRLRRQSETLSTVDGGLLL